MKLRRLKAIFAAIVMSATCITGGVATYAAETDDQAIVGTSVYMRRYDGFEGEVECISNDNYKIRLIYDQYDVTVILNITDNGDYIVLNHYTSADITGLNICETESKTLKLPDVASIADINTVLTDYFDISDDYSKSIAVVPGPDSDPVFYDVCDENAFFNKDIRVTTWSDNEYITDSSRVISEMGYERIVLPINMIDTALNTISLPDCVKELVFSDGSLSNGKYVITDEGLMRADDESESVLEYTVKEVYSPAVAQEILPIGSIKLPNSVSRDSDDYINVEIRCVLNWSSDNYYAATVSDIYGVVNGLNTEATADHQTNILCPMSRIVDYYMKNGEFTDTFSGKTFDMKSVLANENGEFIDLIKNSGSRISYDMDELEKVIFDCDTDIIEIKEIEINDNFATVFNNSSFDSLYIPKYVEKVTNTGNITLNAKAMRPVDDHPNAINPTLADDCNVVFDSNGVLKHFPASYDDAYNEKAAFGNELKNDGVLVIDNANDVHIGNHAFDSGLDCEEIIFTESVKSLGKSIFNENLHPDIITCYNRDIEVDSFLMNMPLSNDITVRCYKGSDLAEYAESKKFNVEYIDESKMADEYGKYIDVTIYSDTDNNGATGMADIVSLAKYNSNNSMNPLMPQGIVNADVNRDGAVDMLDANIIIEYHLGTVSSDYFNNK